MKDARHHLKQLQKKVVQNSRREALLQEWENVMDLSSEGVDVLEISPTPFIDDEDIERSREERAPRVVPQSRAAH